MRKREAVNTMMQNNNKYLKNIMLSRKRRRMMEYSRFQDDFSAALIKKKYLQWDISMCLW